MQPLDKFTQAYIVCALWSTLDGSDAQGGDNLDQNYDIEDIDSECLESLIQICQEFQSTYGHMFVGHEDFAGHDFWLASNHHGSDFRDNIDLYGKENAELLVQAAQKYKEVDLYVGDDGKIYC